MQLPFEAEVGVSTIPFEPNAISVPPFNTHSPSKSTAVSPEDVGPHTMVVPPFTVMLPLESSPSPSAST